MAQLKSWDATHVTKAATDLISSNNSTTQALVADMQRGNY
jgi:phenylpyruvate tautomerase PptA (4-oxalocrotonate tautomerase family)